MVENEYPRTFEDLVCRRMGIESKKHWKPEFAEKKKFDEFFLPLVDELSYKINIKKNDVLNYQI